MLFPIFVAVLAASVSAGPFDAVHFTREPITANLLRSFVLKNQNASASLARHPYAAVHWDGQFGSNNQILELAFSTASVQTLVPKVGFSKGTERSNYYDPSTSTTAKLIDKKFQYVDGNITAKGETYEDYLRLLQFLYITRFGAITELNGLDNLYFDGQVGLAWKPYTKVEPGPTAPFIHSILKDAPEPVFQFFNKIHMSSIRMGMEGITYCQRHTMYRIPLLKGTDVPMLLVESFELGKFHYGSSHAAYLDSSVGSMLLPDVPYREVMRVYQPKFDSELGLFLVKCHSEEREWELTIGGIDLKVTDDQLVRLRDGSCALLVEQSDRVEKQTYTLGMPFFYRHCVTFDVENNKVGITKSVS